MFIGRENELNHLNMLYESDQFEFAVIYGRRRVGKSTLIRKFCENKKSIYYLGIESGQKDNLEEFSQIVMNSLYPAMPKITFKSYEDLFQMIDSVSNEKIILAIDEYPYLAQGYEPLSSLIQKHIDTTWKYGKLKLILCGSSMSFMENQILGYKSPLYGRRTAQFKIQPFLYHELKQFNWCFSNEDLALIYAITGGVGEYLSFIRDDLSVKENILQLYLNPQGRLFEEPVNLLKQELREPRMYHSILNAIANGKTSLNDIAQKIGDTTSSCSYYLNALIALGIVEKEIPVGEKENTKKTVYSIKDSSFIFWYRFVRPYLSILTYQNGEYVYDTFIEKNLSHYMGKIFEKMCREYMLMPKVVQDSKFKYASVGKWWGTNPETKNAEEIDICAMDKYHILIGECKWYKEAIGLSVLNQLIERGKLFSQENKYFYLFSKKDFTDELLKHASKNESIKLISLENLISI